MSEQHIALLKAFRDQRNANESLKQANELIKEEKCKEFFRPVWEFWLGIRDLEAKHYRWHSRDRVRLRQNACLESQTRIGFWGGDGNNGVELCCEYGDHGPKITTYCRNIKMSQKTITPDDAMRCSDDVS